MNTIECIAALKKKLAIDSDYALAKALGVSKQSVSRWSQGKGHFDDDVAIRVAEILGVNPVVILASMHAERSKTPQAQAVWFGLMEKFSTSFEALMRLANPRPA